MPYLQILQHLPQAIILGKLQETAILTLQRSLLEQLMIMHYNLK